MNSLATSFGMKNEVLDRGPNVFPSEGTIYMLITDGDGHFALNLNLQCYTPNVGAAGEESCLNYVVSGWLLCDGSPVDHEPIEVKVNGNSLGYVETGPDGSYSFWIVLQPVDNKQTSYQVELVYHGSNTLNLTLYETTPDDTEYAVCTTLQYFPYKPASNTTWLTVEPQSTQIMQLTKTPEQMQADAEAEGWLKPPRPWFSWWYPWFRLYYTLVYNGNAILDVGLSPIGGDEVNIYSPFDSWLADAINEIIITPIAKAYLIGWIATEIAVYAGMYAGPVGFALVLVSSIGLKEALFMSASDSGLKGAFVGALFAWAYGSISILKQIVNLGITALSDFLKISELNLWKLAFKFIYIPINMIYLIRIIFRLVAVGVW
jgi:hypothetical protein